MVAAQKIEPRFWTYDDAAQATKLCKRTLERHVSDGRLPCLRLGRTVRFRPLDVMNWLEKYGAQDAAK